MNQETSSTDWNSFARTNAAERWKRQSAAMGRPATDAIVAEARIEPDLHILDVACGSGEPAISIASTLQGTGHVIATDISPAPLEVARNRAAQRELKNIEFQRADAHALPFAETSFDRVTSRLGIMFFDEDRAFREIYRVLKHRGRFSFLAWGPLQQPYFETTVGTVLRILADLRVPEEALRAFRFADLDYLRSKLLAAGFTSADVRLQTVPWTWNGSAAEVWEYFQELTIPFKPLMSSIPQDRRAEIDNAVLKAIRTYEHHNGENNVTVDFTATFAIGSALK